MKRRWIVTPIIVGILALGALTAGATLAQDEANGEDNQSTMTKFTARVAAILGLDEAQVEDAFEQARQEMENEVLQNKLNNTVENGILTQEEADSYLEWLQDRPDGIPGFLGRGLGGRHDFGHHGFGRGKSWPGQFYRFHQIPQIEAPTETSTEATAQ